MHSSPSPTRRLRGVVLAAMLLGSLVAAPGRHTAVAADKGLQHSPFLMTGTSTVSGGGLPKEVKRVSYRLTDGGLAFEMAELLGPLLIANYETDLREVDYTLTFAAADLVQLGGQLQGRIQAALGGAKTVAVTVTGGTGTLFWDPDRTLRQLAATFLLEVSVDGGPAKKAKCKVKASGGGRRVLLLDDEVADAQSSGDDLTPALEKAGHYVFNVGKYSTWDGSFPPIDEFETVLWCQRFKYQEPMQSGATQAIDAFVNAGHGLVRTEWSAYQAISTPVSTLDAVLPVTSTHEFAREFTWNTVPAFAAHPLVAKLPKSLRLVHTGFSIVTAAPGSTVVSADPAGVPCITFAPYGSGTIVHLNYGRWERTNEPHIPKKILQAFANAVVFTAP